MHLRFRQSWIVRGGSRNHVGHKSTRDASKKDRHQWDLHDEHDNSDAMDMETEPEGGPDATVQDNDGEQVPDAEGDDVNVKTMDIMNRTPMSMRGSRVQSL